MKNCLNIEQSAELIKRGVSERRATSSVWSPSENAYTHPIFTVGDLISLLPKKINNFYLEVSYGFGDWTASYILWDNCDEGTYIRDTQGEKTAKEFIDVLYELLLWCLDNHVKLD